MLILPKAAVRNASPSPSIAEPGYLESSPCLSHLLNQQLVPDTWSDNLSSNITLVMMRTESPHIYRSEATELYSLEQDGLFSSRPRIQKGKFGLPLSQARERSCQSTGACCLDILRWPYWKFLGNPGLVALDSFSALHGQHKVVLWTYVAVEHISKTR